MNGSNDNKNVSNINSGFPDYLDFDKLRSEGIDLLGKLSGKIWTDHNVHDPGITILEILCYALLDLGYRTNLPFDDILTRNPDDKTTDSNFFTASRIFACNPVTIADYRRLLADIPGVKNAWLEVADDFDPHAFCNGYEDSNDECCVNYLNGLYHVYIETERNSDNDVEQDDFDQAVVERVKKALMSHRNLGEDFIDIKVLCRLPVGICADIELEEGADPETVYVQLVEKLQEFLSPSPRFYTLQQLVEEKNRPIEDVFAGRPYNLSESHGFTDAEEFENIRLKKRIQLSDLYTAIFEAKGIGRVQRLSIRTCDGKQKLAQDKWAFDIPKDHVPEFSVSCSAFRFIRHGIALTVDFKKYAGLFEPGFRNSGKVLYKHPSPYLDYAIPKGTFHADLGDYYSIQNEFPRVYGINEGGLPAEASDVRQAQALQLKAYLLFFDQLLANYAAQLKQLRQLFSLSIPESKDQRTYFAALPDSVPDLQKLLSFRIDRPGETPAVGEGSVIAIPVDRCKLEDLIDKDGVTAMDLKKGLPQFSFSTSAGVGTAVSKLVDDLLYGDYEPVILSAGHQCYFFSLMTSSCDFALISRRFYESEREAKSAATSLKYAGTFDENFKTFNSSGDRYSFDVELNVAVYSKYLQLLAEDKALYHKRRQQFLDHLLARFAESFTDYALLSYGIYTEEQVALGGVKQKERFLTSYDALSSRRGKASDYVENGWENDNISGLEHKFKALAGIENWSRHNLCHFEVYQYQPQFVSVLKIADRELFAIEGKFETRDEAEKTTRVLFQALADRSSYTPYFIAHERAYTLEVCFDQDRKAYLKDKVASESEALATARILHEIFAHDPPAENIFISRFQYRPQLRDYEGEIIAEFSESYETSGNASGEGVKKINARKKWNFARDRNLPDGPFHAIEESGHDFLNLNAFKTDISDTIIDKPHKFSYEVLDKNNQFKFRSVNEFDSQKLAREDCRRLILALASPTNYNIDQNTETGKHRIAIIYKGDVLAVHAKEFTSEKEAQKGADRVHGIVRQHRYTVTVDETPDRWKFRYNLGVTSDDVYAFVPDNDGYETPEAATESAKAFFNGSVRLEVSEEQGALRIIPNGDLSVPPVILESEATVAVPDIRESLGKYLALRKAAFSLRSSDPLAFRASVDVDEQSRCGQFVYHLVDNDNLLAFSSLRGVANDKATAEPQRKLLIQKAVGGYDYLEIAMGGDIVRKRRDRNTKRITYHYQIKTLRPYHKPGESAGRVLVLFESTQGYETKEDAEKAFRENYLLVLMYAGDLNNYLKTNIISDKESSIHVGNCCKTDETIVFIPKETLDYLGDYTEDAEKELVRLVRTFPIRMTEYDRNDPEFRRRFPCERTDDREEERDPCKANVLKYVYYFVLYDKLTETEDWQSTRFYETAEEAKADFTFFLVLLGFEGNYYVRCDPCDSHYKIYVREVLAESAERFETPARAWGEEGVQKFICTAQTENSLHTYLKKKDCCYSFYVGCSMTPLYHPCQYDTPGMRDEAMELLYYSFQKYHSEKLPYLVDTKDPITLYDSDDNPVATVRLNMEGKQGRLNCEDPTVVLMHSILTEGLCIEQDRLEIKFNDEHFIRFIPIDENENLRDLKDRLVSLAWYYPIVMREDKKSGEVSSRFCIEIRYPGIDTCAPKEMAVSSCGCGDTHDEELRSCYVAWKSACCFSSCADAREFYEESRVILSDYSNYRPVFECDCGPYGIALGHHPDLTDCQDRNSDVYHARAKYQLIAVNPQCYPTPEMACKAVERGKSRINSEGLFLVEHILLRPHCREECECDFYRRDRCDETGCEFVWNNTHDEDPCNEVSPVCFVPGSDPYSFIATVALPAWPQRFRKKENRELIENLLQREAPAHVLLRILWLAPHDLCCFEQYYKKWILWLAKKSACDEFRVCDFLNFLFNRNFECLKDCMVCNICPEDEAVADRCFEEKEEADRCFPDELKQLNQINGIFCWAKTDCCNYRYMDCERDDRVLIGERVTEASADADWSAAEREEYPGRGNVQVVEAEIEPADVKAADEAVDERTRRKFINQRLTKYKDQVKNVAAGLKNKPSKLIAGMTESFLMDNDPSVERMRDLADEIIKKTKAKGKAKNPPLGKEHAEQLVKASLYHYLDKRSFGGDDPGEFKKLADVFKKMRAAGFDLSLIYKEWHPEEVKRYEPLTDLKMLRSLMVRGK